MSFSSELEFESALIKQLFEKGWEKTVLKNKTEKELLQNWADILFENNRGIDRLNDYPLTSTEMDQIVEQIRTLRTPLKLNGFINGKTIHIKRDNPDDKIHCGKEVSLTIYDRQEIAAGRSRYQIAEQPKFPTKSSLLNDRRGDMMLLINGMPVIHIELKRSGVPVSQACNQIEKYAHEGIFTGLFSLVQIFVAMNPEDTVYFANPGPDGKFNKDYYFHWANFNNEPIKDWQSIASSLLSIPMAHQMIGFYTVADDTDGILKVMRSYQYYAASAISDKVSKVKWSDKEILGGYIWHTTGSGKTMTSFKSAQLIANSKDADKVVFLMDRIELGTQSLLEYRGFADDADEVQATENTDVLIAKLKSSDPANTLIVTSIQKMSNIKSEGTVNDKDIATINGKRLVFIIDECHRSTFGEMLSTIKNTFPSAIFFGFTGTPIYDENQRKMSTTATVFGNELHRYSIADGIRDKNVLGFDAVKKTDEKMVLKKKDGKDVEVQDGYMGHVLPFELVQKEMLADKKDELSHMETRLTEIVSAYDEFFESLTEEEKSENPEILNDDGDALVFAGISKKAKQFQKTREHYDEESIEARIIKIATLLDEEKTLKRDIKVRAEKLLALTKQTIENLSDEQAKYLLNQKWIKPLCDALNVIPDSIVSALESKINTLTKKYSVTMLDVEDQIAESEKAVAAMIDDLEGDEFDMIGLKELQKLLKGVQNG